MEKIATRLSQTFAPSTSDEFLLKKNRQSRITAQQLPHGVVLFKNCLDEDEQISLVRTCLRLADDETNKGLLPRTKFSSPSKKAVPLLFYNWPAVPASLKGMNEPTRLLRFGRKLFKTAYENSKKDTDLQCPHNYNPNALYAVLYPHGGSFIPHVDGAKGWALSISVGDSANFFYSEVSPFQPLPFFLFSMPSSRACIFQDSACIDHWDLQAFLGLVFGLTINTHTYL